MTEGTTTQCQITIKPLTDEEVNQLGEFLQQSQTLIDRIKKRRRGKPLSSSWRLIRQAREERSKRL